MGADGVNPIEFLVLVGDADRQWLSLRTGLMLTREAANTVYRPWLTYLTPVIRLSRSLA